MAYNQSPQRNSWIESLNAHHDWLYKKMASPREGWSISLNERDIDVPLNSLDASAYQVLLKTIEKGGKIALALPKVKPGVSLSLVAYLVMNRFLSEKGGRYLPGFHSSTLAQGQQMLIATKHRNLRDYFLKSSFNFNDQKFPLTSFRIKRIKRSGEVVHIVGKETQKKQVDLDDIIFYHLDPLQNIPEEIKHGFVMGEVTESDSTDITERIIRFVNESNAHSSIVFINHLAHESINALRQSGYKILYYSPGDVAALNRYHGRTFLTSLASSLSACPSEFNIDIKVINEPSVDRSLLKIHDILTDTGARLGKNKPKPFIKAWGIYYGLKDLAVPLPLLEAARKRHPWLKSFQHTIETTFNFPLNKLDPASQAILEPVWGTLKFELLELYRLLTDDCKKYWALVELVMIHFSGQREIDIIFPSKLQAEVFKEDLLLEYGWSEYESVVKVSYLGEKVGASEVCDSVIVPGLWKHADRSKLFSLLPKEITFLGYPSELTGLSKFIEEMNTKENEKRRDSVSESLAHLSLPQFVTALVPWVTLTDKSTNILNSHLSTIKSQELASQSFLDEELDYSGEYYEADEPDAEEPGMEDKEPVLAYQVSLEKGRSYFIPSNQSILVYSDEDESVHTKYPDALSAGDIILVYSSEKNREMFQETLKRTRELSKADEKIISQWNSILETLRKKYGFYEKEPSTRLLNELKQLGCTKTNQTMREWLKGLTLAPRDIVDIAALLQLASLKNPTFMAKLISREIDVVRTFNRLLGKRLRQRLSKTIRSEDVQDKRSQVDIEIDELLESAEPLTVTAVEAEPKMIAKDQVATYILG